MEDQIITADVLEQIGVTPTPELINHLNETLEQRIGVEITEALQDEKLEEYLDVAETADSETITRWLVANIPDLQVIRQDNVDILLGEIAENHEGLNVSNA